MKDDRRPLVLQDAAAPDSQHLGHMGCGKPGYRCARGELHGPYAYGRCRRDSRQRKAYVRLADLAVVAALAG